MPFIKNFDSLATTPERKAVLELVEAALTSIQPDHVMNKEFTLEGETLKIHDQTFDLQNFDRVFLIGFGKGSAGISKIVEEKLGDRLTEGHVIDTTPASFTKIHFTQGTHPNPSTINLAFTQALLKRIATLQLTERDLVLVVICGGGSALFEAPYATPLEKLMEVGHELLSCGADIIEMNVVRQHLSEVKGGGLAERLFPARIASLIFSDVPGNDLTYIASGPTAQVSTNIEDAKAILQKYNLTEKLSLPDNAFIENPTDTKYFASISNIIVLSNLTALDAMRDKAEELQITATIFSDKFKHEAKTAGSELISKTTPQSILLAGGETTVHVIGSGRGGRNQEVVLGALATIDDKTIICSFDSDGWDFDTLAGALGDTLTKQKAQELQLDIEECLNNNDSLPFFEKTGDGIETGRLPSNVSDLFIVYKY